MLRPGADANNVQMADVLCDFCHQPWTDARQMVEGHQGRVICGACLAVAYAALVIAPEDQASTDFACTMCRETPEDRIAEGRGDIPGWPSPLHQDVWICRRCVKQAAGALHRDPDTSWRKPDAGD
jgi:ribosomal protein L37AE/L43A